MDSRTCRRCGQSFVPRSRAVGRGLFCSKRCARKSELSVEERFWSKVLKTDSCWLWQGSICGVGYGHFGIDGHTKDAHRLSWEMTRGPIPDGMRVLHNCPAGDRRDCVNPDHLWLGTQADNIRDMWAKGRGRAKLTSRQVAEIRELAKHTSLSRRAIGLRYGVSKSSIQHILIGRNWKEHPAGSAELARDLMMVIPSRLGGR